MEQTAIARHCDDINRKILPALGQMKLADIRPHTVTKFLAGLRADNAKKDGSGGYSSGTIKKTFAVLPSILSTAVKWELIESNPCERATVPDAPEISENLKFFTPEQASAFLAFIDKPYTIKIKGHRRVDDIGKPYSVADYVEEKTIPTQFRVLYNIALFGGLRKGELLALQWSDVNWGTRQISISKSAAVVNGQPVIKSLKTKTSRRTVSLPESVIVLLCCHYLEQTQNRLRLGEFSQEGGWIFTQTNGVRMDYSKPAHSFRDTLLRYNESVPEDQQLPLIPFHGLRHTSATLLISSHQDVRTVSARLGHARTSTTMNVYAHALKESDRNAADALETMLIKHA